MCLLPGVMLYLMHDVPQVCLAPWRMRSPQDAA